MLLAAGLAGGCATRQPDSPDPALQRYAAALARTAPTPGSGVVPGSPAEQEALQRFKDFYADFSAEPIRAHTRTVYAPDAYFRDPYKEIEGIDTIEAYFLSSVEPVQSCRFDIHDVASHDGEYYVRWTMELNLKRHEGRRPIRAIGVTHLRFDSEGRVRFHQDNWDASSVLEELPLIGRIVIWIKNRI
jgi:hypothetical protein